MSKTGLFIQRAAAGSGKTSNLVDHVVDLLSDEHETGLIVVATYARQAAMELHQRIMSAGGAGHIGKRLVIGTLHSVAGRVVNHYRRSVDLPPLKIHTDGPTAIGLAEIISREAADTPSLTSDLKSAGVKIDFRALAQRFSCLIDLLAVDCTFSVNELDPFFSNAAICQFAAKCLIAWRLEIKKSPFSDYTRIIPEATDLMRRFPNNAHLLAPLDVVIDEFQDLSPRQFEFVDVLGRSARSLYAVGCPDQSIFNFRAGGTIDFDCVAEHLVYARHLAQKTEPLPPLDFSYRCPNSVAVASVNLLTNNTSGMSVSMRGHSRGGIAAGWFNDEVEEVETVTGSVGQLPPACFGKIAILSRTHQAAEPFFLSLIASQVPVRMMRADDPSANLILARVSSWLRISLSPADIGAGKQILRSGVVGLGPATVAKIEKHLTSREAVHRRLMAVGAMPGLKRPQIAAILNLSEKIEQASVVLKHDCDLIHWLQWLCDQRSEYLVPEDVDTDDFRRVIDFAFRLARACQTPGRFIDAISEPARSDHVTIGTFHAAKGREWETVFIVGATRHNLELLQERCADNLFAAGVLDAGIDGERRLFHVGMTRASENLIITWSGGAGNVSRFIDESGLVMLENSGIIIPRITARPMARSRKDAALQLVLF